MRNFGRAACAVGIAVSIALTSACGSDSDSPADPAEPVVDLASLNVGGFPTQIKPYDKVNSIELAKLIEAERLANYLPLPSEIMPEVKYAPSAQGGAVRPFIDFSSAAIRTRADADPDAMNEAAQGFVGGFVTTGRSDAVANLSYELDNVVMVFSDDQAAADAAAALGRLDLESGPDENQAVEIPDHPEAIAFTVDNISGPGQLRSWYATGKFVIFTYVYDSVMSVLKERDLPKLLERAKRSIEVITPRVAEFPATPSDQLMDLQVDPDGVLARALFTVLDDNSQRGMPGVYDRQGGLQISSAPEVDGPLFEKTGVDRVAWRGSFLYRTRDAAAAAELIAERTETSRKFQRADSPQNLPNAQCHQAVNANKFEIAYYCFVSHGRYAAEVAANQLLDAQQRISAQYALLVNSN
ncbi:hypothetical protein HLB23_19060 [Nocardia uniformis]|uniref:Uncharacterized protein n=1 Tax=Nocardia uniformis TaxID=53432 RepID=A0A849CF11_9NOCA|nr:hypothetical protein [Nocardia uniformis]NNH71931.1 hypothetical protein [Nocardia uniformis]